MPPLSVEVLGGAPPGALGTGGAVARPLLLLHGFTQSARSFDAVVPHLAHLAPGRTLVAADLPGHGGSGDVEADLWATGDLIVAALEELPGLRGERVDVLGYSLGARAALHLALGHPGVVRHLVLVSGTAGIADPAARTERRRRDDALADELERENDVGPFVRRWLENPMFASLKGHDAAVGSRLVNRPKGLAASLRTCGAGAQEPLWESLGSLGAPTLLLSGATDLRFTAIAERMAGLLPEAVRSLVPGAGHAAHLEQPRMTARLVTSWLDALPADPAEPSSAPGRA